jgi:chemotaxis protein MotB
MIPSSQPIVIKRKKAGHGGHHGGAWKVAYADFVTALMAFFLVMWLVGQSQEVKRAVAGYFRDPGSFDHAKSDGPIPGGQAGLDPDALLRPAQTPPTEAMLEEERASLEQTAARTRQLLAEAPDLKDLNKQIEVQVTRDGLRIELLEAERQTFFASGSSALAPGTERVLSLIARELGKLKNSVVIEGHTDSRPYSTADVYSNWELSADRANAARRVMERTGLAAGQVRGVRGYADRHLRVTQAPLDPRNRRVSVIVEHMWRPESLPESVRALAGGGRSPAAAPAPAASPRAAGTVGSRSPASSPASSPAPAH